MAYQDYKGSRNSGGERRYNQQWGQRQGQAGGQRQNQERRSYGGDGGGYKAASRPGRSYNTPKPPSEKQVRFAQSLSEKYGLEIPEDALGNGRELSKWIDEQMAAIPPSEKQIEFMENLARRYNLDPPEEAYSSKKKCSEWLDQVLEEHKEERNKQGKKQETERGQESGPGNEGESDFFGAEMSL